MNKTLILAASLNAFVAIIHLGCIVYGASWYRFLGAGEQMAVWAEQGNIKATLITLFITAVLLTWSVYVFSAAGVIAALPFVKLVLVAISAIYLLRGVAGFFFINNPMGRTPEFWWWSSFICLAFAAIHLLGLKQVWAEL
ncbi:MAG: hypothetical protein JKX78_01565 [Alteromonadaceae bacterium]|nr:hypothetical protein [Alteromonadaceae bacterium]